LARSGKAWRITGSSLSSPSTPISSGAVTGRPDQHRQVFVHVDLVGRIADAMPDVGVRNSVFPCWFADPHVDNLPCLNEA